MIQPMLCTYEASAFWVWTSDDKNPVNPKYAAKDTPEEQYEWSMYDFKAGDFKKSSDGFLRLVEAFKDSDYAPEAQYFAGRSFEELGKYYFAYQNYQKTVDNYPYTKRLDEIVEREYNIAVIFAAKESPKLMNIELNDALDKSVEICQNIVDNATFGNYADKAVYLMADNYRRMRKYKESVDAYEKLITDYPKSDLVEKAKYELADTMYEASLNPDYDQETTDEALVKFEKIMKTTPVPEIVQEADRVIAVLKNKKAASILKVAAFYEKQKKYDSAKVYYKDVMNNYPGTLSAQTAELKLIELGGRS